MKVKPHMRWEFDFCLPHEIFEFKNWVIYKRVGVGVTVLRLLGVTVRVFK